MGRDKEPTRRPQKLASAGSHYHSRGYRSKERRWWSWSLVRSCCLLRTAWWELWPQAKADITRHGVWEGGSWMIKYCDLSSSLQSPASCPIG